ncbi:MAG: LicD family protein, partial [Eubacterium sp.]|nr:LicD family protein [Eubacterium sp.]
MSELTNKTNENRLFFDKIIDGFFVPSMMQKWWAVSYKNFTELDSECRKEGYDAFGMWGTMLGCVRNSGFIPWDDDFDSLMFREMFNKLYYRGKKGELPKEYWISDYEYNQNENMVRTWVDTKSIIRKPEDRKDNYGFALYNPIDIFILDTLPRDEEERKAHYMVVESYATLSGQAKLLAEQKRNGTDGLDENEIIDEAQLMENIRRLSKSTGIELEDSDNPLFVKLYKAMDEFCSRYKQGQGNLLTIIAYMINIEGFQYDKSLFAGSVNLPFDHGTIPLPISYDQILRMSYGDYMCPTLMGGVHGYPVYDSMEEQMRKKANIEYHKFRYDNNSYRAIVNGRNAKISVSTQVKNSIELFGDAHRFIQSKCANGDVDETLLDVLGQCQDLAVSVGERVETDAIGGEDIVKEFEKYCGDIYELYQLADGALS